MVIKEVVIHKSVIEKWAKRSTPPVALTKINSTLDYINQRLKNADPDNVVIVEDSVGSDEFNLLPKRVGKGNEARLMGTRAGYCMKEARSLLEDNGIKVELDSEGSLA